MGEPLPVTGSSFSKDRVGIRSIPLIFIIEGPGEEGEEEPYDELDNYKPTAPLGLVDVGRSAKKLPDGDWELTITFEGVVGDGTTGAVLEYDNSKVEDPIQSFPQFNLLKDKYKAKLDGDGQFIGWPLMMPDPAGGGKPVKNPLYGDTHFFNNGTILRITFVLKDFKEDLLQNLCKIDVPQVPEGTQDDIKTPSGMTWLKVSVKAQNPGNCWRFEIEWMLGVWCEDIYNAKK